MSNQILRSSWALAFCCCALPCVRVHAAAFVYPNFSSTSGLNLVPSATQSGSDIRVTAAVPSTAGAVWHATKQAVQAGFDTTFSFRITAASGVGDANALPGGDGLAFVVQNTSNTALGLTNSYMGYEIANSLAVEFDTWRNPNFLAQEPSSNHVGVQSAGTGVNSPFAGQFLGAAGVGPNMSDGNAHLGRVLYLPGSLKVYVDDLVNPALSVAVNLGSLLNLDSGTAYVGFTAGGADAYENHDLLSWTFISVPEPASVLLFIIGGLLLYGRRRIA